ncbi:hypothetical protein ACJ41O_000652 [Fusarium nematophilum]
MPPVSLSQVERACKLPQSITRSHTGSLGYLVDRAITQTHGLTAPTQPLGNTTFSRGMHLLHRRESTSEIAGISIGLVLLFVLVGAGLCMWTWKATEAEKRRRARKHRRRREHRHSHRRHRRHRTSTKKARHGHVEQHNHDHDENHHHGVPYLYHDLHNEKPDDGLDPLAFCPGHRHHHHRRRRHRHQNMEHGPGLQVPETPFLQEPEPAILSPKSRSSRHGHSVQLSDEMEAPQIQRGFGRHGGGLPLWAPRRVFGQSAKRDIGVYSDYGSGQDGHGF